MLLFLCNIIVMKNIPVPRPTIIKINPAQPLVWINVVRIEYVYVTTFFLYLSSYYTF